MIEKVREQFDKMYQTKLQLPEKLEKEYEVISCLKHTEQKQVYLLRQKATGKKVVLKCGLGMYQVILKEECGLLMQMRGNGFPKVVAWEEQEDMYFLVREYVEGDTLKELMEKEETLTRREALEMTAQVCRLLNRLHSQKPPVIYRDVKPQNVVRTSQGECVLIDLDTARIYKEGVEEDTVFMGTRGLASPEQYGYQQTDVRTDVYGVGMLLLYLVTGGYDRGDLERQPQKVKKVIETCTAFNPKERYSSVQEVEKQLRKLLKVTDLEKAEYREKRLKTVVVTVTTLVFCLLISGAFFRYNAAERPKVMKFANSKIEQAVREMLQKPEGEILVEELNSVYTLIILGDRIFDNWEEMEAYRENYWFELDKIVPPVEECDLSDLAYFTNLKTLVLEYQNVTEIPDLSHLSLVRVSFAHNDIKDISALSNCTDMKILWLSNNPIEDVRALKNMRRLESLDIAETEVEDLTPVVSSLLESLYCNNTNVTDYTFLAQCTGLRDIRVSDFSKEEVVYMAGLPRITNLSFFESKVDSLLLFKDMERLEGLELAGNRSLTSLEGFEYLTSLSYLGLSGTNITELPDNFSMERLNVLELTATDVTDFTPLLQCPRLRTLYISEELVEEAQEQLKGSGIEVIGI